ncbi:MAG TPA: S8 family serine peptidase [Steroidobacteraceae bacterium]|nr:S8 family serine peptidase [Steroidobacteraceae bacterium]
MFLTEHLRRFASGVLIAGVAAAATTGSAEFNPVMQEPHVAESLGTADVIFKLKANGDGAAIAKLATGSDRVAAIAKRSRLGMSLRREISTSLLAGTVTLTDESPDQVLERLRADPAVQYAVPDHRRFAQAVPNDPLFNGQWYLQSTEVSAVNAVGAWDLEQGRPGVVVAVLDTGVLYDHPDLGRGDAGGKLLPGRDFVTLVAQANDGDGRDADPSDPGDWVNDADKAANVALANCDVTGSSWHGTRVSGMIGALSNNGAGITGLSWNSFLLPVRVLGKCGGKDSDILAGMRWAAGLTTPGVPNNPTPARILNMSLGSTGACESSYRTVIDELTALKVLVVVSAGNEGTMVSSPADCPGVAGVAALRHAGSKVGFSNLGPEVTVGAPGGNCVNISGGPCLFSLDTTSNTGTQAPGTDTYTNQQSSNLGTSFSAPIVSGIAALMLSRNNNLSTTQLLARLREGAVPFPTSVAGNPALTACHVPVNTDDVQQAECLCTVNTCGAGMANAANSVVAADRPIAAVAVPALVSAGQNVVLNAGGSAAACNRTVASYSWTVVQPTTNPPVLVGANTSTVTVIAPSSGGYLLRVTVTDDQGHADSANVTVESNSATTPAPASAGTTACAANITSGATPRASTPTTPTTPTTPSTPSTPATKSGGGGSLEWLTLGLLGLLVLLPVAFDMSRAIFAPYAIDGSGSPLQQQLKALRQECSAGSRDAGIVPRDNELTTCRASTTGSNPPRCCSPAAAASRNV